MMHPADPRSPESRHEDTSGAEPDDAVAASGGASAAGVAVDSQVAGVPGAAVVTEAGSADSASPPTVPAPPVPPTVAPPPERRGWSRRRKIFAWVAGALAVLLVVVVTGAYLVYRHLNGNLHQVNVSGLLGHQPVDLHPQAENILVIGSDTRFGQGRGYGSSAQLNTDHSDTLLIVHIAESRQWANIMSIP